ncbi:hypothetical protein CDIK_2842 [Cucumispora dikerogammari]|nr:hypothetical protein CDIK_2842 [Cucumispora dikerogammari]
MINQKEREKVDERKLKINGRFCYTIFDSDSTINTIEKSFFLNTAGLFNASEVIKVNKEIHYFTVARYDFKKNVKLEIEYKNIPLREWFYIVDKIVSECIIRNDNILKLKTGKPKTNKARAFPIKYQINTERWNIVFWTQPIRP